MRPMGLIGLMGYLGEQAVNLRIKVSLTIVHYLIVG